MTAEDKLQVLQGIADARLANIEGLREEVQRLSAEASRGGDRLLKIETCAACPFFASGDVQLSASYTKHNIQTRAEYCIRANRFLSPSDEDARYEKQTPGWCPLEPADPKP